MVLRKKIKKKKRFWSSLRLSARAFERFMLKKQEKKIECRVTRRNAFVAKNVHIKTNLNIAVNTRIAILLHHQREDHVTKVES